MTLQDFFNYFQDKHGLEVTMMSQGTCMLYSFFLSADKKKERLGLPITEVRFTPTNKYVISGCELI